MSEKIYGVNLDEKITPEKVRDAMSECFYEAHCADSGIGQGEGKIKNEINREYCTGIVKKAFADTGGDYAKPTKASISEALDYLKGFAKNFRNPGIIDKHYKQIMKLYSKLD